MTRTGVDTRRLYRFEDLTKSISPFANRHRSESFLRKMAEIVWQEHGRRNQQCPDVRIGSGIKHDRYFVSFCEGRKKIELTEAQATVCVLLHGMTHAIGFGNPHGKGFVRKYFELLVQYGKCEQGPLIMDAKLFGISI